MDAALLDKYKENIVPLPEGRPAEKLGTALAESSKRSSLLSQKNQFEQNIQNDELDDPLQAYLDYISWTHNHYPQGVTASSGLLGLLERCTLYFRDVTHYKNDARYLKVWMEYASYSDLPRDVFVYLAKKDIGQQLALYYEEFAKFLELSGNSADAREVYEIGMEREARPLARLTRTFEHFKKRSSEKCSQDSQIRQLLTTKRVSISPASRSKRPKIEVYNDTEQPSTRKTIFVSDSNARLASATAANENKVKATPWAGEMMPQRTDTEKAPASFQVYRDPSDLESGSRALLQKSYDVAEIGGKYVTIQRTSGKPTEHIQINMRLVEQDQTYGISELATMARRARAGRNEKEMKESGRSRLDSRLRRTSTEKQLSGARNSFSPPRISGSGGENRVASGTRRSLENRANFEAVAFDGHPVPANAELPYNKKGFPSDIHGSKPPAKVPFHLERDTTFTIPLRDDDNTTQRPRSPTVTMNSRAIATEVAGMFNTAAAQFHLDDELTRNFEESTSYSGFVTETANVRPLTPPAQPASPRTPATDAYDSLISLPFVELP